MHDRSSCYFAVDRRRHLAPARPSRMTSRAAGLGREVRGTRHPSEGSSSSVRASSVDGIHARVYRASHTRRVVDPDRDAIPNSQGRPGKCTRSTARWSLRCGSGLRAERRWTASSAVKLTIETTLPFCLLGSSHLRRWLRTRQDRPASLKTAAMLPLQRPRGAVYHPINEILRDFNSLSLDIQTREIDSSGVT